MHRTHGVHRSPGRVLGKEALALLISLAILGGCGGDGGSGPSAPSPLPVLSRVSPDSLHQADANAQLTLRGSGFVRDSRVLWNGVERTLTYVDHGTLRLSFEAEDL
jgi:hypothetical protein